ncbi:MAG TPA: dihydrofolate reductase family protein, partial [Chloroflexota bacterium]|nr:dihydrofolate reductase family protein [Chloroflexota bacterium]
MVHLAINMVATLDGRAALGGTATGIGSAYDRQLMKELRAEADVVLHGAGTVRADPLSARVPADLVPGRLARGMSEQPLGAI